MSMSDMNMVYADVCLCTEVTHGRAEAALPGALHDSVRDRDVLHADADGLEDRDVTRAADV